MSISTLVADRGCIDSIATSALPIVGDTKPLYLTRMQRSESARMLSLFACNPWSQLAPGILQSAMTKMTVDLPITQTQEFPRITNIIDPDTNQEGNNYSTPTSTSPDDDCRPIHSHDLDNVGYFWDESEDFMVTKKQYISSVVEARKFSGSNNHHVVQAIEIPVPAIVVESRKSAKAAVSPPPITFHATNSGVPKSKRVIKIVSWAQENRLADYLDMILKLSSVSNDESTYRSPSTSSNDISIESSRKSHIAIDMPLASRCRLRDTQNGVQMHKVCTFHLGN